MVKDNTLSEIDITRQGSWLAPGIKFQRSYRQLGSQLTSVNPSGIRYPALYLLQWPLLTRKHGVLFSAGYNAASASALWIHGFRRQLGLAVSI